MLCQSFGIFVSQVIDNYLQSIVQNYSGLLATRFFLGLAEAGVVPRKYD